VSELVVKRVEFDVGAIGDLRAEILGYRQAASELAAAARAARKMMGMSLREVAEKTGLGAHTLRRVEQEERMLTPEEAEKLADWLVDLAMEAEGAPIEEWPERVEVSMA